LHIAAALSKAHLDTVEDYSDEMNLAVHTLNVKLLIADARRLCYFWKAHELHVVNVLILAGEQLVLPEAMKRVTLQATHAGHMSIERASNVADHICAGHQ